MRHPKYLTEEAMMKLLKKIKGLILLTTLALLVLNGCAASGGSASIQGRNDAGPHLYGRIGVGYSI